MSFPIKRCCFSSLFLGVLLLSSPCSFSRDVDNDEALRPPLPLNVGDKPSPHSLLVFPDEGPVGYATSSSRRTPAPPISRRYVDTPQPESTREAPTIRPATGGASDGRTVQVSEPSPASRLALTGTAPGSVFREQSASAPSSSAPATYRPISAPNRPRPVADVYVAETAVDPHRPPVRTASFLKVIPGTTTFTEVIALWGEPVRETTVGGNLAQLYSTEILNHIEVLYDDAVVKSIVVRLDEPFPEEQVRDVLKSELLKSKPVLIPDETGQIIGEVFPEKGVLFLFTPSDLDNVFLVRQIGIEPVTAEPFVLRAEATLTDHPFQARRDLEDAVRIDPGDAKAYWLLSRIELMEGRIDAAMLHIEQAIRLDDRQPSYHIALVQILIRMNRIEEAGLYLEETLEICDRFPHEKARAYSILGDLFRTSPRPDYERAVECHSDAIRIASTLIDHANPTIRQSAKDVLFEAHLGAARDIAWGRWDEKEESIAKWIAQAKEIASDPEMISAKRFSLDYPFKIAVCSLAAQVGLPENRNIEAQIREVVRTGDLLIQSTGDPILQRKFQWETSLSLYDAVQIYQLRKQYGLALKYGEVAAEYMESGIKDRKSDTDFYLLGRLYFRLGAIHAIGNKNHRAAIEWFDKAKPVFEKLLPKINPEELGRLGETLVSMGVSYWMTGQQDEAVRITERGLKQIERGVRSETVDESVLAIPYSNLANMYRELGQAESAQKYARLATTVQ